MNTLKLGDFIKKLREEKGYTQAQLAEMISVSDKTISKWENKRGLPDITLFEPLSHALGVSVIELFNTNKYENKNKHVKLMDSIFYVCPICGNVIVATGKNIQYCCGNELLIEESSIDDNINIEHIENEIHVNVSSPMTKTDYISFYAYITYTKIQFEKLYPEGPSDTRFQYLGKGIIYYYNNKNGLFKKNIKE